MAHNPTLPSRYKLIDEIGEGATCLVYKAEDQKLGRDVAIKIVRRNLAIHTRFRARFRREVATSAEVVHPRVIPVLDTGRLEDGCPYVSLAHADHGSLSDLLKRRPPMGEAIRLMQHVLDALAHIHARGFLHQDLKPANVLLHSAAHGKPDAWVADLGFAGAVTELALHQQGMGGTPVWMAPEQRTGRYAELGPWTDLYAVGLMLFEILGGDRSGKEPGTRKLLDPLPRGPLGLDPVVPQALEEIVRNLLQPDPRQRYDRAVDVTRAIERALSGTELQTLVPAPIGGLVGPSFSDVLLAEGIEALTAASPVPLPETGVRWNRVSPDPMPMEPPPHPASGAEAGGVAMVSLREPPVEAHEGVRWALWQQAREVVQTGEPRVVLIVGATGIGKSRTAQAVVQTIEAAGHMETAMLRYHRPATADDGYRRAVLDILAPWNENRSDLQSRLQRWLSRDQQRTPEQVAIEASVLARWCGYMEEGETPVNAAAGLAFLYRHLDARSWRGGALILLEDVHHAEEAGEGLHICEALLDQSIGERPFLAIATISEEAIQTDERLANQVQSLEQRGAMRIALPRMSEGELRTFLRQSIHLSPTLAEEVATRCEGSPGKAMLMVRDLATRECLAEQPDAVFGLRDGLKIGDAVPEDANALFLSRIQGAVRSTETPHAAYEALAATALAGQSPPVMVVREINPEGLDSLLATGLLRQRGGRLIFEHSRIHSAALQVAMGRPQVQNMHRRLAEAWERLGERTGADVDFPVGMHRLHAGEPTVAVIPLLRAARRTHEEGRFSLAINAARLGTEAADKSGGASAKAEARIRMADTLIAVGNTEEAIRVIRQAQDFGHLDRRTQARLWNRLGEIERLSGNLDSAHQYLQSAEVVFEATRDRDGLMETAYSMANLKSLEGRPTEAARHFARMLRLNRNDRRIEVQALRGLVDSRSSSGRLAGVEPLVQQLREAALATGDTRCMAQATFAAGLVELALQNFDSGELHFHTARALAATVGDHRLQLDSENNLGEVYRLRGEMRAAERMYKSVVRMATDRKWPISAAVAHLNLCLVSLGRENQAFTQIAIDQAEACLQDHPHHWAWLFIGTMRAMWAAENGDEPTCRAWWSVANERGLGRMLSRDLLTPLERLAAACDRNGWRKIALRSLQYHEAILAIEAPAQHMD